MRSILLVLLCAGCASLNPVTAWKISRLDPLTADPADFTVRVELPDGLRVPKGQAYLELTGQTNSANDRSDERYVLHRNGDLWAIAMADWPRLRAQQARLRSWKETGTGSGSLSVQVTPCAVGNGPDAGATFDIDLQFEAGGEFLPLLRNAPLAATGVKLFAPCDTAAD